MQNISLQNLLLIDIETVSEKSDFDQLDKDWQILWEEKTSRTLPEGINAAAYYQQRAGVMAEFAKIVCISIGYFKKEEGWQLRIKSFYHDDEKVLLKNFIDTIQQIESINNKWCFTGHNIKEFDIPFLCRRLLINNFPIPPYLDFQNMKPWETNMIDTFQYWRFGDYKNYTSLKLLAASLKVPSPKDDIDGSMVGNVYWKENDLKRIAVYCQKDVVTVANIILRFKNMELLKEEQIVFV
ncbi:ribonuclease H-like domain-containing protein [Ferruginibacter lapsinanis]|uniref:ribonuclease H-like domain-containing protein n=1 Tax=Ferruginibacter lapsinanis TaxID=563172 RepID=UPI001E389A79|nr:ribonuclease H-like domain-containing protein [Ferruginibacter lapsinanis]UEG49989.1 ribonuclease H-like domain-containing protein [Ferruginibacter lapsinanis]